MAKSRLPQADDEGKYTYLTKYMIIIFTVKQKKCIVGTILLYLSVYTACYVCCFAYHVFINSSFMRLMHNKGS